MSQETFLEYRNFRWFWITLCLVVFLTLLYLDMNPKGGPNGGTIFGYFSGTIAAAAIVYLLGFAIRKRNYMAYRTDLKGALSAHVWIGAALLVIVPLHSGFSFGLNVHTLAFALMVITILSGMWGVFLYNSLPPRISSHRGGANLKQLVQQILQASSDIDALKVGKGESFMALIKGIDFPFTPSLRRAFFRRTGESPNPTFVADLMAPVPDSEMDDANRAIALVNRKYSLAQHLEDEARVFAWLKFWLYIHVPISFALLAALTIHIFSVFYYW